MNRTKGFTLVEMLVAVTVASILTGAALNAYGMFHRGVLETSDGYVRFATEKVKELRCETRFVRGRPPCDSSARDRLRLNIRKRF